MISFLYARREAQHPGWVKKKKRKKLVEMTHSSLSWKSLIRRLLTAVTPPSWINSLEWQILIQTHNHCLRRFTHKYNLSSLNADEGISFIVKHKTKQNKKPRISWKVNGCRAADKNHVRMEMTGPQTGVKKSKSC